MLTLLPESVSTVVLTDWVELKAVARVDSAFCVRKSRPDLVKLLSSLVVTSDVQVNPEHKRQMIWLRTRSIGASRLLIETDQCSNMKIEARKFLKSTAQTVRTVVLNARLFQYCDTFIVTAIATYFHNLTELYCGNSATITAKTLALVLKRNPNLRVLTAELGGYDKQIADFTPNSLPHLTTMTLMNPCAQQSALIAMAGNLQHLTLQESPSGSSLFIAKNVHLKTFTTRNTLLTEEQAMEIVTQCPNIETIDLQATRQVVTLVNDSTIMQLAQGLKRLRHINLFGCVLLTNLSLQCLVDQCANTLLTVRLGKNPLLTCTAVDYARHRCPNLHVQYINELHMHAEDQFNQVLMTQKPTVNIVHGSFSGQSLKNVLESTVSCSNVHTIYFTSALKRDSVTPDIFSLMFEKWTNLSTLIVQKEDLACVLNLAAHNFPYVVVAADCCAYARGLLSPFGFLQPTTARLHTDK